jgi:hypothetical protein
MPNPMLHQEKLFGTRAEIRATFAWTQTCVRLDGIWLWSASDVELYQISDGRVAPQISDVRLVYHRCCGLNIHFRLLLVPSIHFILSLINYKNLALITFVFENKVFKILLIILDFYFWDQQTIFLVLSLLASASLRLRNV